MSSKQEYGPLLWFTIWCLNGACVTLSHFYKNKHNILFSTYLPLFISSCCAVSVYFLPYDEVEFRAVVSLSSAFYLIKTSEVILEDRLDDKPLWLKISSVIATFYDVQDSTPAASWFIPRLKELLEILLHTTLHVIGLILSIRTFQSRHVWFEKESLLSISTACVSGCFYSFFSLYVYGDVLDIIWLLLGIRFPPLMNNPIQSVSVGDFWKRWDTVIQKLLFRHIYIPCRKRGLPVEISIALTFFSSGLVHVYPIFVALGNDWQAAFSMMSYFMVQFSVVILEKPLQVTKWNPMTGRLWTLFNLFGPSYLLVAPCLQLARMTF